MIPKVIHQVWMGPHKAPAKWMDTWPAMNPGWEYRVWTEDNFPWPLVNQRQWEQTPNWHGRSNIVRYELLQRFGGLYLDADLSCRRPLDDSLVDCDLVTCCENDRRTPGLISCAVLGAVSAHPAISAAVEAIGRLGPHELTPTWQATGPAFWTRILGPFLGGENARVRLLPGCSFFPTHHTGLRYNESEIAIAYADHHWASTNGNYHSGRFTPPTLSVIIPTLGRMTLARTLASIRAQQRVEGDEVLVVQDGPASESTRRIVAEAGVGRYIATGVEARDFGSTPRNRGMDEARGDLLLFMDDDDVYRPGAFEAIRSAAARHPGRPMMFRNWVKVLGRTRWADKTVRPVNVGTPMFVVPNVPARLGRWPGYRGEDFAFIHATLRKWPVGALVWEPFIIADYLDPGAEPPRPMVRNLIYHVYPVATNEEWQLNVRELARYWNLFNGRKIVGIVVDDETLDAEAVKSAFPPDPAIEWLVQPNVPDSGEVITWLPAMKQLESLNPDEATFYAHAKGVTHTIEKDGPVKLNSVRRWRNYLYRANLGLEPNCLDNALRSTTVLGALRCDKKFRPEPGRPPALWHFVGTFFWINHGRFFAYREALTIGRSRWAIERHAGEIVPVSESTCIGPELSRTHSIYQWSESDWDAMDRTLESAVRHH